MPVGRDGNCTEQNRAEGAGQSRAEQSKAGQSRAKQEVRGGGRMKWDERASEVSMTSRLWIDYGYGVVRGLDTCEWGDTMGAGV